MKFINNTHIVTKPDIIQYRNFSSWLKIITHTTINFKHVRIISGYGTIEDELGYIYGFNFEYKKYKTSKNRRISIEPVKTSKSRYGTSTKISLKFSKGVEQIIKQRIIKQFN